MGLRAKSSNNNNNSSSTIKTNNPSAAVATTTTSKTTCISATFRSSSTSAIAAAASCMRPQTLNVNHLRETPMDQTQLYLGEILNAWRAKARCNVVPAERTQELFHELSFNPSDKQISEMLQTAKMLARKGSRQSNGLTFGEFCVLAADLKRFRTSAFSTSSFCDKVNLLSSLQQSEDDVAKKHFDATTQINCSYAAANAATTGAELRSTKSLSNVEDCKKKSSTSAKSSDTSSAPVEVFLGGSCNPTTWRADVAIPALQELGISFYNPQVSDWTPDLIELEHRAKEKARVLFFVMDSETRASAGAIEVAHIAGQNCKQLVLVLHPYRPNQYILNEHISQQEYNDLTRNQLILKELVTRRGLPVLDNIPSGLQRTKDILAGIRDPPSNIASILVVIRGAFDRVSPVNDVISIEQCQRALSYLGYAQSLLNLDNIKRIVLSQRESLNSLQKKNATFCSNSDGGNNSTNCVKRQNSANTNICAPSSSATLSTDAQNTLIDFDLFCVVSAYLSVLQQEIHESGCISPIKGTNVPPPPVYLTNMQGDESFAMSYYSSRNISRTSSNTSVPSSSSEERQSLNDLPSRSRDSGTSSPQPVETPLKSKSNIYLGKQPNKIVVSVESLSTTSYIKKNQTNSNSTNTNKIIAIATAPSTSSVTSSSLNSSDTNAISNNTAAEDESDSNDSVFSSSSSINSVNYNSDPMSSYSGLDFRDVYLGGSCFLRTTWRQEIAMPYLKSKGVTFHLPALHESIQASQLDLPDKGFDEKKARTVGEAQERTFIRTRRKCKDACAPLSSSQSNADVVEEEDEVTIEETFSWALPSVRTNLFNPSLIDSSRVLLFVITNETRSLAPMTLAAHCIALMYNVVLAVQMLPEECVISNEKLTPAAIKDYNRGRSYLIDLAKRQGVPVFSDLKPALECTVEKIKACNSRQKFD